MSGHHDHGSINGAEERVALLRYMIDHNMHHLEELRALTKGTDADVEEILSQAADGFEKANTLLAGALEKLRKQDLEQ